MRTYDIEIRAAPSAFMVFGGIIGVPLVICIAAAIKEPSMWTAVAICVLATLFLFVWLRSFRITIKQNQLEYSTLFGGTKTIQMHQIADAEIEFNLNYFDHLWSTRTLTLRPKSPEYHQAIQINVKVFPRDSIKNLMMVIESMAASTEGNS